MFVDALLTGGKHYQSRSSAELECSFIYNQSLHKTYSYQARSSSFKIPAGGYLIERDDWEDMFSFHDTSRARVKDKYGKGVYSRVQHYLRSSGVRDRMQAWDLDCSHGKEIEAVRLQDIDIVLPSDFTRTFSNYFLTDKVLHLAVPTNKIQNVLDIMPTHQHKSIINDFVVKWYEHSEIGDAIGAIALHTNVTSDEMRAMVQHHKDVVI